MRRKTILLLIFIPCILLTNCSKSIELSGNNSYVLQDTTRYKGSYLTGIYENLFSRLLGKKEELVKQKINSVFTQLFYGNDSTERLYFPIEPEMAYIEDILHKDVRTEGMSYGMMIAVQMDKKGEFDRLWKWAKTYMQHKDGPRKNYFAWHCEINGKVIDSNSASDGEEWIVMALFFASARWGNGEGIFNYRNEAQNILDAMLHKESEHENDGKITNMFNKKEKQVVFVPEIEASGFTDPSYHLPHFYELWARWADKEKQFWCKAAKTSRDFLKKASHSETGLFPDYANFDGTPINFRNSGSDDFRYDAWRVAMNIAIDYVWFTKDIKATETCNKILDFFYSQGVSKYGNLYKLNGEKLGDDHSLGLISMNAVAALASTNKNRKEFVEELWDAKTPVGIYRYYDGILYMIALLQVSGNFRIYDFYGEKVPECIYE